jgi:RNA polymerase sigma-70 factor (ECF subfamily)
MSQPVPSDEGLEDAEISRAAAPAAQHHADRSRDADRSHDVERPRDVELVRRIRLGDAEAFEELFHAYYEPLCGFVLGYVRSAETAEDVVQEMLASLWERRTEWDVRGSVRGYLFSAARNRALSHLRHARVVARWQESALREIGARNPAGASADERVRTDELAMALARAIERLPARRRQTYTLRWQQELSLAEIAAVMGVTVKCVETQLASASKAIREALADFF